MPQVAFFLPCTNLLLALSIAKEFSSTVLKSFTCTLYHQLSSTAQFNSTCQMSENAHLTNTTRKTFSQSPWKHNNNNPEGYKEMQRSYLIKL